MKWGVDVNDAQLIAILKRKMSLDKHSETETKENRRGSRQG